MMKDLEYFVEYFCKHKVFKKFDGLKQIETLKHLHQDEWKKLKHKERRFILIHLKDKNKYLVLFKHIDEDLVEKNCHPYGCKIKRENSEVSETTIEIEIFSSFNVEKSEVDYIRNKIPDHYIFFNTDHHFDTPNPEKTIIFMTLFRLYNFDLHFHDVLSEMKETPETERSEFIEHDE